MVFTINTDSPETMPVLTEAERTAFDTAFDAWVEAFKQRRLEDEEEGITRSRSRSPRASGHQKIRYIEDVRANQEDQLNNEGILDMNKYPAGYYWQLLNIGGYKRYWTIIDRDQNQDYPGTWTVWFNQDGYWTWVELGQFLQYRYY